MRLQGLTRVSSDTLRSQCSQVVQDVATHCPTPQLSAPQATLLLALNEVTEGEEEGDWQLETLKKVPEGIFWRYLLATPLQTAQRELCPSLGQQRASEVEGRPEALGRGVQLSLVPPFREDAEGNRPGE